MAAALQEEIFEKLKAIGSLPDDEINLFETSLLLAAVNHSGRSLDRYRSHMKKLAEETGRRHKALAEAGADDDVKTRLAALKHILCDQEGYRDDEKPYGNLDHADIISVIDRRCGMPLALAILYIGTAQAQGWKAEGLDIPGHFAVRLEKGGERLIFDSAGQCRILEAADLRMFVKQAKGPQAELSADYFTPVSGRTLLVLLQNHIKLRQVEAEDYKGALRTVENMIAFAPEEYRLLLDAGILYERTEQPEAAIKALEDYIARAPGDRNRREAALLLQQIRHTLN